MKNLKLVAVLLSLLTFHSAFTYPKKSRILDSTHKKDINLNYSQFVKYLDNGNPDSLEGIYSTEDKRYVIAVIKNETKFHEFIGVVISSDNPKWSNGEIKFNFVRKSDGILEGYYYNSDKVSPVVLSTGNSRIGANLLKKLSLQELEVNLLVSK